jgi:hypothetical protein
MPEFTLTGTVVYPIHRGWRIELVHMSCPHGETVFRALIGPRGLRAAWGQIPRLTAWERVTAEPSRN